MAIVEHTEILFTKEQISARVAELGRCITEWATTKCEPITVVWLAEGALMFAADILREIKSDVYVRSLRASSYGSNLQSSGNVNISANFDEYEGKNVLIIDDIFETGFTLQTIIAKMREVGAKDVKTCVLLRKSDVDTKVKLPDFIGFDIPNKFVFGYGLDKYLLFRNLDEIKYIEEVQSE